MKTQNNSDILQLVTFNIGEEEYAVDILTVQEINKMLPITKVPNSPDFIEGIINLRGRVIPVIDLRIKLGFGKKEHNNETRIIVVELNNRTVGFIVDAVSEVIRIPANITETPPDLAFRGNSEFIEAVGKFENRLLLLINLNKILSASENSVLSEVG